ncbi:hypothetical protein PanWU01x14_277880 [Parasponia andersonii]|uniref:Uncharacterized protein n=1 Tax=Parasponia andersonii TaxID=3476 RepID=A0A2P5B2P8_PARAD|nr:hypothetical protein PanWU01x14_277880 [Parasponia andersonii]
MGVRGIWLLLRPIRTRTFPSISRIFCVIIFVLKSLRKSRHRTRKIGLRQPRDWRAYEPYRLLQEKHAEMVMSRAEAFTQTQSRAQSELRDGASSAESVVGPEQVDEFQIMSKTLGTRSRWQKGLGALPQLKSIGGQRVASTGQVAKTITTLKQQLAEKDAEHAQQIDKTQ